MRVFYCLKTGYGRRRYGRFEVTTTAKVEERVMSELESFINDGPVEEPVAEEAPAETAEPEVAEPEQETSTAETEESTEVEEPEGSPAEPKEEGKIPIAALLDEREKRQQYERRVKELEQQLQPAEEKEVPDPLDDKDAFVSAIRGDVQSAILNERANVSEFHARNKHDDFDTKWPLVEAFLNEKGLGSEVVNHVDPYGHAFKLYDDHQEMEQLKDPNYMDKLKAELKEELRQELQSEVAADAEKADAKQKLAETLTPSLANQRAEGANKPVLDVPDPLDTTFNR